MNQLTTTGIVLSRTNYGEADRIITMLTPEHGKLRLMAKGVRRVKSKLAGGIELFSVSNITFIPGRGDIGTLVSTRLLKHYGHIISSLERVQLGYDLLKQLNKTTEDNAETDYFDLIENAFLALDDISIDEAVIRVWFDAQLLRLGGHTPNLHTDPFDAKLSPDRHYEFDYESVAFRETEQGRYGVDHIKLLRLIFNGNMPKILQQVVGYDVLLPNCAQIIQTMRNEFLRI